MRRGRRRVASQSTIASACVGRRQLGAVGEEPVDRLVALAARQAGAVDADAERRVGRRAACSAALVDARPAPASAARDRSSGPGTASATRSSRARRAATSSSAASLLHRQLRPPRQPRDQLGRLLGRHALELAQRRQRRARVVVLEQHVEIVEVGRRRPRARRPPPPPRASRATGSRRYFSIAITLRAARAGLDLRQHRRARAPARRVVVLGRRRERLPRLGGRRSDPARRPPRRARRGAPWCCASSLIRPGAQAGSPAVASATAAI